MFSLSNKVLDRGMLKLAVCLDIILGGGNFNAWTKITSHKQTLNPKRTTKRKAHFSHLIIIARVRLSQSVFSPKLFICSEKQKNVIYKHCLSLSYGASFRRIASLRRNDFASKKFYLPNQYFRMNRPTSRS